MSKNDYPKQPYKPDRKPSESVTWVRVAEEVCKRPIIVVKKMPKLVPIKNK